MKSKPTRDGKVAEFELQDFLPYLLNQAAEATSLEFQKIYSETHGMTRTQWRVLANLGQSGPLTAKDICRISHEEKTKVSRAILALETAGFLNRKTDEYDRRSERLRLTMRGSALYRELGRAALDYDRRLSMQIGEEQVSSLKRALRDVVKARRLT